MALSSGWDRIIALKETQSCGSWYRYLHGSGAGPTSHIVVGGTQPGLFSEGDS